MKQPNLTISNYMAEEIDFIGDPIHALNTEEVIAMDEISNGLKEIKEQLEDLLKLFKDSNSAATEK